MNKFNFLNDFSLLQSDISFLTMIIILIRGTLVHSSLSIIFRMNYSKSPQGLHLKNCYFLYTSRHFSAGLAQDLLLHINSLSKGHVLSVACPKRITVWLPNPRWLSGPIENTDFYSHWTTKINTNSISHNTSQKASHSGQSHYREALWKTLHQTIESCLSVNTINTVLKEKKKYKMYILNNITQIFAQPTDNFCLGYIGIFICVLILAINTPVLRFEPNDNNVSKYL